MYYRKKPHRWRRMLAYRRYMRMKACVARLGAGMPGAKMKFYGITGTDGKSTTSFMLYTIFKEAEKNDVLRAGILSTVYVDLGAGRQDNTTHLTSVSHRDFWQYIKQAEQAGVTDMIVEVSSHALYQYRTWPMHFEAMGMTNLSREHLDFHWTMGHYAQTKLELLDRLIVGGVGIFPYGFLPRRGSEKKIKNDVEIQTFMSVSDATGATMDDSNAEVWVSYLKEIPCLEFDICALGGSMHVSTGVRGSFNCDNMMIAYMLASRAGISLVDVKSGCESFVGLPGRQELVVASNGVTVMIDFALTPDAFRTLYSSTRGMLFSELIAVFGATGDRDQGKRPEMGAIAAELCDMVIVTEDENYSEDGMVIMKQIEAGIVSVEAGVSENAHLLVQDRREAIVRGLEYATALIEKNSSAKPVIILTGMANFQYRRMGTVDEPWDERSVVEEEMERLGIR